MVEGVEGFVVVQFFACYEGVGDLKGGCDFLFLLLFGGGHIVRDEDLLPFGAGRRQRDQDEAENGVEASHDVSFVVRFHSSV